MSGRLQAEAHAEGQKEVITAKSACGMALRGSALPLRYVPDPSNHAQFLPELFNSAEEAKAMAEKLKAAGDDNVLDEPINMLPPVLPEGEKTLDMLGDMGQEALTALGQGNLGSVATIAGSAVEEGLSAVQEDEFPWDKVAFVFFGFALLANSAQFVYPLLEEILEDEEDDFDRLPMPMRAGARKAVSQIEEIDLKLPPKPMSDTIAEKEKLKKPKQPKPDFKEDDFKKSA
ncbi:unnamed protein product [Symbiodinium natans]|uniref:Uncharacterized protein n=1 Tax=Symbiodinium natans TaxID=878477 RepID=A0A812TYW7_9DINO|nr:unnamed protein product [Symbiodinium natans]